jgi:hypothetical protein
MCCRLVILATHGADVVVLATRCLNCNTLPPSDESGISLRCTRPKCATCTLVILATRGTDVVDLATRCRNCNTLPLSDESGISFRPPHWYFLEHLALMWYFLQHAAKCESRQRPSGGSQLRAYILRCCCVVSCCSQPRIEMMWLRCSRPRIEMMWLRGCGPSSS